MMINKQVAGNLLIKTLISVVPVYHLLFVPVLYPCAAQVLDVSRRCSTMLDVERKMFYLIISIIKLGKNYQFTSD